MRAFAFALAILLGCSGTPVGRQTRAMIERELDTARLSGFKVQFRVATTELEDDRLATVARSHPDTTWLVLHPGGMHIYPANEIASVLEDASTIKRCQGWVSAYLGFADRDGAARALVRGYSELLRTRAGYQPRRALAPLMPPEATKFRPRDTAAWGIPVAMLVLLLGLRVDKQRRSHSARG